MSNKFWQIHDNTDSYMGGLNVNLNDIDYFEFMPEKRPYSSKYHGGGSVEPSCAYIIYKSGAIVNVPMTYEKFIKIFGVVG